MKRLIYSTCYERNRPVKAASRQARIILIRRIANDILNKEYAEYRIVDMCDLINDVINYFLAAHNPILDLQTMKNYGNRVAYSQSCRLIHDIIELLIEESNGRIIDMSE